MAPIIPSINLIGERFPFPSFPSGSERARAEERARNLLLSYLMPYQRWMLSELGWFYVRGRDNGLYALFSPQAVLILNSDGRVRGQRNIWLSDPGFIPPSDSILAQYLTLRADPGLFWRVGCTSHALIMPQGIRNPIYLRGFLEDGFDTLERLRRSWPQVDGLFGA